MPGIRVTIVTQTCSDQIINQLGSCQVDTNVAFVEGMRPHVHLAGGQADRQVGRKTGWQSGREEGKQADRQADRKAGGRTRR